jgi:hypothetical protein
MAAPAMALAAANLIRQFLHGHPTSEQTHKLHGVEQAFVAAEPTFNDQIKLVCHDILQGDFGDLSGANATQDSGHLPKSEGRIIFIFQ